MEKGKNNNGLVALLVVVIIVMAIIIFLLLIGKINLNKDNSSNIETITNNNITNKKTSYNYSDIKGLYEYKSENMIDESGTEFSASYFLYLYENGTFNYRMASFSSYGYMGNYIISDNTVVLNYLFSNNSGSEIEVTTGTKTLTINSDNTLTDTNQLITAIKDTSVILTKASLTEENEFLQSNDFTKILNDYNITNNADTTKR